MSNTFYKGIEHQDAETQKDLRMLRTLCLIGAACSPVIAAFWCISTNEIKNNLYLGIISSILLLFVYLLSYISGYVCEHSYIVTCLLIILGNAAGIASSYLHNFSVESDLLLVLLAYSLIWVFKKPAHLACFISIFTVSSIFALHMAADSVINRAFFTLFLIFFSSVNYFNAKLRLNAIDEMKKLAYYDELTGMPNRHLFNEKLDKALQEPANRAKGMALMFIDLDQFKVVNDTMGHNTGDIILKQASERLAKCVREEDVVARYGGDEFVVLLRDIGEEGSTAISLRILNEFRTPFLASFHEIFISPSIGISLYPKDAEDSVTLLKNADTAMYTAKMSSKNSFLFYSKEMNDRITRRIELEASLRKALANGEFELYYQPQVDIADGAIAGMEALLRWNHPALGVISPSKFIPLAEETGLINQIGEWVLETACEQNKAWQQAGFPHVPVSVNVSGKQFADTDIPELVKRALSKTKLEHRYLDIEITESVLHETGAVTRAVKDLRAMGVKVSIDDFGTGYSSLNLLKNFTVDNIKIDSSFISDMSDNPNTEILVKYIIDLGHRLNITIIAEGIEREEQRSLLERNGCDLYQGYFFSRPLPAHEIEALWKDIIDKAS